MLEIRLARPDDFEAAGRLLSETYVAEGWADEEYGAQLADVATRATQCSVFVAHLDGRLVGLVTAVTRGGEYANVAADGEAEVRMLVTAEEARGRGVGLALVEACLEQAREDGCSVVRLSTQPDMAAARRLYERLGFVRTPERDWSIPDRGFLTYALELAWCGHCGERGVQHDEPLEPPRWCTRCRRRMVVQVHPTGWTARCSVHGTVTS